MTTKKTACLVCRKIEVELLLDLGEQPLCNRFPKSAAEPEYTHPMRWGACASCGVAQLLSPPPAGELKPHCDWITYNEPEPHLDGLADRILKMPGIGPNSAICGVSPKDESLLRRLRERGVKNAWGIDPQNDLGESDSRAFVETVQTRLTVGAASAIAAIHGPADLVIARHIFEHCHEPTEFFEALKTLAKPGGRVLIEVPDCERAMRDSDYIMLWEEHSLYLTAGTFRATIQTLGGAVEHFEEHPYALENSLVAVAKLDAKQEPSAKSRDAALALARGFAAGLDEKRRELKSWAGGVLDVGGKIAVFGAGHLGTVWVNLMGLGAQISCFIDDNPNKKGLRMPGSRLPILGSDALDRENITWALMAFNPESEDKVIAKNPAFIKRGGKFASILPGSPRALSVAVQVKL